MTIDNTYKDHKIFTQLSEYAEFYESLSFLVTCFMPSGTKFILNFDSYLFSSMQGTLESIKDILTKGRINDAYALMRKYYDSTIINIYTNLYLEKNFSIENFFLEKNFSIENFIVEQIDNWLKGKEKLPEYRKMSQYIREAKELSEINDLLYKDKTYKKIRDRCNDNTHYNFFQNVLLNNNRMNLKNRLGLLNTFSKDLENIFIMHLSYLFYLNDHYMMSSDYIDCLDCGVTPEEDSQYLVAPFIQKIFDTVIKKSRIDLVEKIKNNTSMMLE